MEPKLLERVLLQDKRNRHGAVLSVQSVHEELRVEVKVEVLEISEVAGVQLLENLQRLLLVC